jgi:hypothetical protein
MLQNSGSVTTRINPPLSQTSAQPGRGFAGRAGGTRHLYAQHFQTYPAVILRWIFVAQHLGAKHLRPVAKSIQGYNCRHWTQDRLDLFAVSDIVGGELDEFVQKIARAVPRSSSAS